VESNQDYGVETDKRGVEYRNNICALCGVQNFATLRCRVASGQHTRLS